MTELVSLASGDMNEEKRQEQAPHAMIAGPLRIGAGNVAGDVAGDGVDVASGAAAGRIVIGLTPDAGAGAAAVPPALIGNANGR